jgi:hypothetical protein
VVDRVRHAIEDAVERTAQGRLLACRIELTGQTCLHGDLLASADLLLVEARAAALGLGEEVAWIERLVVATTSLETAALRKDALGDLQRMIETADSDAELQARLSSDLNDLVRKLPHDVRTDSDDSVLKEALDGNIASLIAHGGAYLVLIPVIVGGCIATRERCMISAAAILMGEEDSMFWREFCRSGRSLRAVLMAGWPWLVLSMAIKTWTWALGSGGSDEAIPALLITIVILATPLYNTLRGMAWQAIGVVTGVAGFSFAVITWLAPHLAAEGIDATIHTRAYDEDYAVAEVRYQLVIYFYLEMAVLTVIAVGSAIVALSRLRPAIETSSSIGRGLIEYWRYRCCQSDRRELNRALASSLTQFICAIFLAYGASKAAIWFDKVEDGRGVYDSPVNLSNSTGAQILAEGALFVNNAPRQYFLDDRLAVPPNELICSNFGRYDLIHKIEPGRVDVIPRRMVQINPSTWETQRQRPLQDTACVSALAG